MSRTLPRQFDQNRTDDEFYTFYHKRQTSNLIGPTKASQTGDQGRKVWLHAQIEKEIRLRTGAEKLLAATASDKLREGICRELSLVNSNLQKMREELTELKISTQNHYHSSSLSFEMQTPMITLGLKETNDVDFHFSLKEILLDHYHEDGVNFKSELNRLSEMRKTCCTPTRSDDGVEKLFCYYNQLYFVDRRFFPSSSHGPVTFVWYDSLKGSYHAQNTIGYEKGCIMFNIAALYAQRAAKQMCEDVNSLQFAATDLRRAAGSFQYLLDNFCNAPSVDMQTDMMRLLVQIMSAQVQECEVRQVLLHHSEVQDSQVLRALKLGGDDVERNIELAQDCTEVISLYDEALTSMSLPAVSVHIPIHWIPVARCKRQYFSALAHWFIVQALGATAAYRGDGKPLKHLKGVHVRVDMKVKTVYSDQLIHDADGRKTLARAHLRQSILASEEALRIVRTQHPLCSFQQVLKRFHDKSMHKFSLLEEEDDFSELLLAPDICPKIKNPVEVILPDFSKFKVEDIFHRLGCIAIFSARHSWTPPRRVTMIKKTKKDEFGFSVRGDCPVIVATVDTGSLAEEFGMYVGDFIVEVGDDDVRWTKHDQVVAMIRSSADTVILRVVTPTDHNYIDPSSPPAFGKLILPPILPHSCGVGMPPLSPHPKASSLLTNIPIPGRVKSPIPDTGSGKSSKERTSSSFSWKLRKRRSHSKDKLCNERRNNASNHSYS